MPYTYTLTTTIPASPEEIYQAWLDSLAHSEMTGGGATMSDELGAEVSAWDGYISGRNLELIPGERIVQSWRTSEFADEHEDSIVTIVLEEVDDGTLLTIEHANVPDEQRSYEEGGWQSNYFEPMVAYFTKRKQNVAAAPSQEEPEVSAPEPPKRAPTHPGKRPAKRSAKSSSKSASKSARKHKRAASTKSKRAGPRAKASPKKTRSKVTAGRTAATARKRAKPSRPRKATRGKRR